MVFGSLARRIRGRLRLDPKGLVVVWRSGIHVSGSRPLLANFADGGSCSSGSSILFRGLRSRLRTEHMGNMPWLFFFSALSIPAFYAVGLLVRTNSTFTTTDFWRFWVVHLWVEDFLELFTTIMVAYIFVLLGVVHQRVAHAPDLSRHDSVFGRRRDWHDAPSVFFRRARAAHGAGRVLLGGGSDSADVPDCRSVELPPTRRATERRRRARRFRISGR